MARKTDAAEAATKTGGADERPPEVTHPDVGAAAGAHDRAPAVAATVMAPTVVVTAVQPSRWRAGRLFGREPVSIPAEDLSEADLAALRSDPQLTVQLVEAPH